MLSWTKDREAILEALRGICGLDGVIWRAEELKVYECDAYTLEKALPYCVVLPKDTDEVVSVVAFCHSNGLPIIPRGSGTSLSGSVLAVEGGVVMALTRMNRILEVDLDHRRILVEAGCVNVWVTKRVAGEGLFYAPDPSSQFACTIGGNVATNSGGPHTLKNGVTTNHVLGLELVLPDGELVWLGARMDGPEDVDGYDLRGCVIGSEGMFGVVTRVLLRLTQAPQGYRTLLAVFGDVDSASRTVGEIIASGLIPGAMEMMDQLITSAVESAYRFGFPLDAGAVLIVELDGFEAELDRQVSQLEVICKRNGSRELRRAETEEERQLLWKSRKRAFGAIGRLSPNYLTQDGVVPRSKLGAIMEFIQETSRRYDLRIANVFHAGDGNIHPLVLYDERDADEVRRAVLAGNDILDRCLELGGSASGEHGIGVEKIDFMAKQFTKADLEVMERVRGVFDPEMKCNPHKMFPSAKRCVDFVMKKQISA